MTTTPGPSRAAGSDAAATDVRYDQRAQLTDDVYATLRAELLERELLPGVRINIEAVARRLHCSNTPVRHALERLASEGLVNKEPFRGFIASSLLDARVIAEIYDTRMMIEPVHAARAAQRGIESTSGALSALCGPDAIDALLAGAQEAELIRRDISFHTTIAEQAGNGVSTETLCAVLDRGTRYSLYHSAACGRAAWEEHRGIVAAIEAGNPPEAREAMRTHLRNGLQRYREAIA